MDPLPAAFLVSALVIFPLAWLGGGHTERSGVALYMCLFFVSPLVQQYRIGNLMWATALIDLVFLIGLVWLALVASAFQVMVMLIYLSTALVPGFDTRSGVVAIMVLGMLALFCLLGGVVERILAGEAPVSASAVWRRRRPAPL